MWGLWVTGFTGHISWPVVFVRTRPSGCDGEGKETQHSFKALDLLGGNNSHGRKTRMKITTGCSGTQFLHQRLFYVHIRKRWRDMQSWDVTFLFIIPFIVRDSSDFHFSLLLKLITWHFSNVFVSEKRKCMNLWPLCVTIILGLY